MYFICRNRVDVDDVDDVIDNVDDVDDVIDDVDDDVMWLTIFGKFLFSGIFPENITIRCMVVTELSVLYLSQSCAIKVKARKITVNNTETT